MKPIPGRTKIELRTIKNHFLILVIVIDLKISLLVKNSVQCQWVWDSRKLSSVKYNKTGTSHCALRVLTIDIFGAWHLVQGTSHPVQGAGHPAQGGRHHVQGAGHPAQGARHPVQGAGHPGVRSWTSRTRSLIPGTRRRTPSARSHSPVTNQPLPDYLVWIHRWMVHFPWWIDCLYCSRFLRRKRNIWKDFKLFWIFPLKITRFRPFWVYWYAICL